MIGWQARVIPVVYSTNMAKLKGFASLIIDTVQKFTADRATRLAAALAYYSIFSLTPLLIILTGIAGRFLGPEIGTDEIGQQIEQIVGTEAASLIQSMIDGFSQPASFTLTTVISLGIMFWGASNIFNHLKETLNIIWGVKPKPGVESTLAFIRGRLLAFALIFGAGFLLVAYFLLNTLVAAAIPIITRYVPDWLEVIPDWRTIQIAQFALVFVVATVLFAIFYRILPDVEIAWRDVWVGALVTSLLFGIGTFALSIYFSFYSSSLYGAAGSLMVVLLWFYYSAQIFLFGAEFTQVYSTRFGSQIRPADYAQTFETTIAENEDASSGQQAKGRTESQLVGEEADQTTGDSLKARA